MFVDTGAWYAASVPSDRDHVAAVSFLRTNTEPLVTSDYIYSELLTLFRARGHIDRAREWVTQAEQHRCEIVRITEEDIRKATDVYFNYGDKLWSFTDCTSRVVLERLGIGRAFAFDDHFRQFGTVVVVP